MGGNVSKGTVEIVRKQILDASIKFLQENISKTTINITLSSNQTQYYNNVVVTGCKNVTFANRLTADTQVFNTMTNTERVNFKQFLTNQMSTIITNAVKQSNKDLNLLQFNAKVQNTSVNESLKADLSTLISSKTQQLFNADITQLINQEIIVENAVIVCEGGDFTSVNTIDLRTILINVMEDTSIADILTKMSSTMDVDVEDVTTQSNDGIGLMDLMLLPIIIIGCIALASMFGITTLKSFLTTPFRIFTRKKTSSKKIVPESAPMDVISLKLI